MGLRRYVLILALPLFAVAGAWLGARGDDRTAVRKQPEALAGESESTETQNRPGDSTTSGAEWLLPYALQPDDLPETLRARLHTETFVTSDYPGVDGEVEAVLSVVLADDPFVGAAFQNLADPGSAPASEIRSATYHVLVSVVRTQDVSSARRVLAEQGSVDEAPRPVIVEFEGDEVQLTDEDVERMWVTRRDEWNPVPGLGEEALRYVYSLAQLDYDASADVYRSAAELRRDTTEGYVVVFGRYVVMSSRIVAGFDSDLPTDIDLLALTRAVATRLESAPE